MSARKGSELDAVSTQTTWPDILENLLHSRLSTYKVTTACIDTTSMNLEARTQKNIIIEEIFKANAKRLSALLNATEIVNIYWKHPSRAQTSDRLIIEVTSTAVANQFLDKGLLWRYNTFKCAIHRRAKLLQHCKKCQAFGHREVGCTRSVQCGKCGGDQLSEDCDSEILRCAFCSGAHLTASEECPFPAREKERQSTFPLTAPSIPDSPASLQKRTQDLTVSQHQLETNPESSSKGEMRDSQKKALKKLRREVDELSTIVHSQRDSAPTATVPNAAELSNATDFAAAVQGQPSSGKRKVEGDIQEPQSKRSKPSGEAQPSNEAQSTSGVSPPTPAADSIEAVLARHPRHRPSISSVNDSRLPSNSPNLPLRRGNGMRDEPIHID